MDRAFSGHGLEVLESIQAQTGVDFSTGRGIGMSINVSDDIFDARTISDNAMTDVLGAHFGCEEKVAQEGIQAIYYGLAAIQSGYVDVVLIVGHCKESQGKSRNMVTHVAFDPFLHPTGGIGFLCGCRTPGPGLHGSFGPYRGTAGRCGGPIAGKCPEK